MELVDMNFTLENALVIENFLSCWFSCVVGASLPSTGVRPSPVLKKDTLSFNIIKKYLAGSVCLSVCTEGSGKPLSQYGYPLQSFS